MQQRCNRKANAARCQTVREKRLIGFLAGPLGFRLALDSSKGPEIV